MLYTTLLFLHLPGGMEWVLIFLAVLLLFGGRKIPELMRGLGRGIREFNTARDNLKSEIKEGMNEADEGKKKGRQSESDSSKS